MKARDVRRGVKKSGGVAKVAEETGVSRSSIYRWMRGIARRGGQPSPQNEQRLLDAFERNGYTVQQPTRSVRHIDKPTSHDAMYRSAIGRPLAEPENRGVQNLRRLVRDLGGPKQAATTLGVTPQTVKSWTTTNRDRRRRPNNASLQKINKAVPISRQRAVAKMARGRRAKLRTQPGLSHRLTITGQGGVRSDKFLEDRRRSIDSPDVRITGDALADYYDALAHGHTDIAQQILADQVGRDYVPGWEWSTIESLSIADDGYRRPVTDDDVPGY